MLRRGCFDLTAKLSAEPGPAASAKGGLLWRRVARSPPLESRAVAVLPHPRLSLLAIAAKLYATCAPCRGAPCSINPCACGDQPHPAALTQCEIVWGACGCRAEQLCTWIHHVLLALGFMPMNCDAQSPHPRRLTLRTVRTCRAFARMHGNGISWDAGCQWSLLVWLQLKQL